jgi:hypothetical protein
MITAGLALGGVSIVLWLIAEAVEHHQERARRTAVSQEQRRRKYAPTHETYYVWDWEREQ